ncbi:flagellar hook-associated protein FlgL [Brevibacillus migulae]|uniref:flagellar hook-associated protein FlgL n=1 Tax=Brevibacillus migulae TaxID=1644114 RepID=UPI00106E2183|nr:flagellar hook-associated protein FlgL [Brevibacillus migulae]
MAIRVTQNMLNSNMLRNLHNSMRNLDKLQEQQATGKKINRPTDDPVGASRGMFYRTSLIENEQYKSNADEAATWMDMTDEAMDQIGDILKRVSELVVASGNDTASAADRQTMGTEIKELKNQLGSLANQTVNGRYIFGGTDTLTPPYNETLGNFTSTNSTEIQIEVSEKVFVSKNINAQRIFNFPDNANNMFKVLDNIVATLSAGNSASSYDSALNGQYDNLLTERASLGARVNRIELVLDRLERAEVSLSEQQSKIEDADMADVATELSAEESVYKAALSVGAKVIQPTLLDFLR